MTNSPDIRVTRRAATRLRSGHPWVYRSDLEGEPALPRGGLVRVLTERGEFLGSALASSSSQIALRMIAAQPLTEGELPTLISARVCEAIHYRERLGIPDLSNAYRLVFSEADQLPGLIVDRYDDVIAFQALTQAMDEPEIRKHLLVTLKKALGPAAIVERVDTKIREKEELESRPGGLAFGEKTTAIVSMKPDADSAPVRFHYDAGAGQKTGAFLDQRENYAAVIPYAHCDALDVFCYQGGFAMHLGRVCSSVTGVDSARPALEAAERNVELNRESLRVPEMEWIEANAFDLLRDWSAAGKKFGTIVLDPPAFAKNKRSLPTAIAGYKEINLRALKMLEPGGTLVTCSCSHHVTQEEFLTMLAQASRDAHRRVRLLEVRGQSRDHPVVAGIPETAYLKCVIAYVE